MGKKTAVLLSGNGVYDGAEIHESVLTLLALDQKGYTIQCVAPNILQHHVIDHTTGNEMNQERNVLIEAARIARGNIIACEQANISDYDALVMPGGFGAAKNLSKWAFSGPEGNIDSSTKKFISGFVAHKKPIVAMCMAPVVISKALEGTPHRAKLTVGTTAEPSPYDIKGISDGMNAVGAEAQMKTVKEVAVDESLKIITSPCYMMEASISDINEGINKAIQSLDEMLKKD